MPQELPNAREMPAKDGRCPCGSGHWPYKLFNHKRELLLLCCHACEKKMRQKPGENTGIA